MSLQLAVIIPGPELKKRIDKTADAVFKQPQLRDKLLQRGDFDFLREGDDFHPYFLQRLQKAREDAASGGGSAAAAASNATNAQAAKTVGTTATATSAKDAAMRQPHQQHEYATDPLPDDFSLPIIASGVPALEMDLIQLAAQHAAVHGEPFVTALQQKYASQRKYDFLSKDHPRHVIFAKLRDAYSLVLATVVVNATSAAGSSSAARVVSESMQQKANALVSRLQLLAGETPEDPIGDPLRAREAFLIECNTKRQFMQQEEARRSTMAVSDAELRNRLNFTDFTVLGTLTLEDLKLQDSNSFGRI